MLFLLCPGIAAFGSSSNTLIPSSFLIFSIGVLSAYGFSLIGRVCSYTGALSYREAWEKSVSPKSGWVPAAACFLSTSCAVLAYSMILSDTIPQLTIAFTGKVITRTQALLSVTSFVLLPLCLMKNLKSLAPFSLMGIFGMFYTTVAMAVRWLDGSYRAGGRYFENLAPQFLPSFAPKSIADSVFDPNIFLLISMLSTAFMAHYNAPKFYWELENNTLARYNMVVVTSFVVSCLLFAAISSIGFATFGKACSGLVLNNYSTDDPLMSLSRVAVAMSLLFSYPLAFVGVRDGILDLFEVKERGDKLLNTLTVGLLAMITGLAFVVKDLGKVLAFGGATWGNAVIYLFPAYMFTKVAHNLKPELKKEVPQVIATGILGLAMGIIGTTRAIKK
jgi:amino acid permease